MAYPTTTYKESGVDIDAADLFIQRIKPLVKKTERPGVLGGIGHFAGLFVPDLKKYNNPVLCASTDGVGTKLKVAIEMKSLKGLGQDLVAMNANDILCLGADPLFFLDYYATGHLDPDEAVQVVQGMTEACRTIGCSVLGGETAEMPSVYQKGDFDLAGFIVGIVNRGGIIDGSRITPGDELIGLASSGPHSNGFSLIRKIIADRKLSLKKTYPPLTRPLGDVLLEPTRLYGPLLESFKNEFALKGIVHITGGGLENIVRILPHGCQVIVERKAWPTQPIFDLLKEWGNLADQEMERVLNLGIGLVMIVSPADVDPILLKLRGQGEKAWRIGRIASRPSNESALKVHR